MGDRHGKSGNGVGRQHRRGAGLKGGRDELAPIDLGPRQGCEQEARSDLTAVGCDAPDFRVDIHILAQDFRQARAHWLSPPAEATVMTGATTTGCGLMPTKGAMRSMTWPAVGAAFQPPVMKPKLSGVRCGESRVIWTR